MNDFSMQPGMKYKETILLPSSHGVGAMIGLRLHNKFGARRWAHAKRVVFLIASGNGKNRLEVQADDVLQDRELGIIIGHAEAWADDLAKYERKGRK